MQTKDLNKHLNKVFNLFIYKIKGKDEKDKDN